MIDLITVTEIATVYISIINKHVQIILMIDSTACGLCMPLCHAPVPISKITKSAGRTINSQWQG